MGLKIGTISQLDLMICNSSKEENLPHSVQISQKMFCDPLSVPTYMSGVGVAKGNREHKEKGSKEKRA